MAVGARGSRRLAKSKRTMLTGNYAAAFGAKLSRAEVVPVYPITPQTHIMEKMTEFISKGELDAEFIPVESEHSVMAAAIAAQATGARTFTASSSQGILYMHENLFVASGMRLPIVMVMANRAVAAPVTIYPDQLDSLAQRDTGWLQLYAENAQEIIDLIIQAYRIAEDERVLLPVAVCFEGLIISHFLEPVEVPSQKEVDHFLPPYEAKHVILHPDRPMHVGIAANDVYYTEYRYQQEEAMEKAKEVILEVDKAFLDQFGRGYGGLVQSFMLEDAKVALMTMGSISGTARQVVRDLRRQGIKIGLIRLRSFRPFPTEQLQRIAGQLDLIAVLDRNVSIGLGGIVYSELATALYPLEKRPLLVNYILGLGGRDTTVENVMEITSNAINLSGLGEVKKPVRWIGVRGLEAVDG